MAGHHPNQINAVLLKRWQDAFKIRSGTRPPGIHTVPHLPHASIRSRALALCSPLATVHACLHVFFEGVGIALARVETH